MRGLRIIRPLVRKSVDDSNALATSNPVTLRVDPRGATLTGISPVHGPRGAAVQVTLAGSDFVTPLSVNPPAGISVTNVVSGSSGVTATFSIDAAAAIGKHSVSVTTPVGDSNPIEFIVTPSDYSDLVVSQSQSKPFAMERDGTYLLVVRNIGLGPTTGAIVVDDILPSGMSFVSAQIAVNVHTSPSS